MIHSERLRAVAAVLLLPLLIVMTSSSRADVRSTLAGETLFIKVTPIEATESVRFELCPIVAPETGCQQIGAGDYPVRELRAKAAVILNNAKKAGKMTVGQVLLTVLASAGGGIVSIYAGGALAALLSRSCTGYFCGLRWFGIGAIAGLTIGTTVTAILVTLHFKKKNKAKRAALEARAQTLAEDVIGDKPVTIDEKLQLFAARLGEALKTMTAVEPLPIPASAILP